MAKTSGSEVVVVVAVEARAGRPNAPDRGFNMGSKLLRNLVVRIIDGEHRKAFRVAASMFRELAIARC